MSEFYNSKRSKNLFDPSAKTPFRLSRTKLDLFLNCPRCFYFDRRLGVSQPPGFPFALNSAVDLLLKKEFDLYRAKGEPHPLMKTQGIDAVPFRHEKMDEWRDAFRRGITFHHPATNFILTGGIDDLWANPSGELHIVDYKSTAKESEVNIDADWQIAYKRQMEVYQWLFRRNGFRVSATGYFVYCNGRLDKKAFEGQLEFDIKIIPYQGEDRWVEEALLAARKCLTGSELPRAGRDCDFCSYTTALHEAEETFNAKESLK